MGDAYTQCAPLILDLDANQFRCQKVYVIEWGSGSMDLVSIAYSFSSFQNASVSSMFLLWLSSIFLSGININNFSFVSDATEKEEQTGDMETQDGIDKEEDINMKEEEDKSDEPEVSTEKSSGEIVLVDI